MTSCGDGAGMEPPLRRLEPPRRADCSTATRASPGLDNELLPWLAHALWHAVEIAGAPEVRDQVSLVRFYARIPGGFRTGSTAKMEVVETVKAQKIRTTVLNELRGF